MLCQIQILLKNLIVYLKILIQYESSKAEYKYSIMDKVCQFWYFSVMFFIVSIYLPFVLMH